MEEENHFDDCNCPACYLEFGDDVIPEALPCGHALCYDCLVRTESTNFIEGAGSFKCFICRRERDFLPNIDTIEGNSIVNRAALAIARQRD